MKHGALRLKSTYISECLARFKSTGNPFHFARAAFLVVKQRRTQELLHGVYCGLTGRLPRVLAVDDAGLPSIVQWATALAQEDDWWDRAAVIEHFASAFAVGGLPEDFEGSRREAIYSTEGHLILGEYGENKRVFHITSDRCTVNHHYCSDRAVRHVHAIHPGQKAGEYFVTTGDTAKYLDTWQLSAGELRFGERLRPSLAGFTAIATVGGETFFGSDFSGRRNYVELLDGTKLFFPSAASRMYVVAFHKQGTRYLVSVHRELSVFGRGWAISILDVQLRHFVHCASGREDADKTANLMSLRA